MRVIRSPSAPLGYFSCLLGLLGGGVLVATGAWGAGLAFALFGLGIGIRGAREAVVLADTGLVIRNLWTTHRVSWREIEDIEIAEHGPGVLSELGTGAVGAVITRTGRRIPLGVTRTMHQRSWTAREAADEIRRTWMTASGPS